MSILRAWSCKHWQRNGSWLNIPTVGRCLIKQGVRLSRFFPASKGGTRLTQLLIEGRWSEVNKRGQFVPKPNLALRAWFACRQWHSRDWIAAYGAAKRPCRASASLPLSARKFFSQIRFALIWTAEGERLAAFNLIASVDAMSQVNRAQTVLGESWPGLPWKSSEYRELRR